MKTAVFQTLKRKWISNFTLIVWVNSMPMRFWSRHGRGNSWTWSGFLSELWILSRLNNCKEPMVGETQPIWISFPVATKSLLSLWPHVMAETGNCNKNTQWKNCTQQIQGGHVLFAWPPCIQYWDKFCKIYENIPSRHFL